MYAEILGSLRTRVEQLHIALLILEPGECGGNYIIKNGVLAARADKKISLNKIIIFIYAL